MKQTTFPFGDEGHTAFTMAVNEQPQQRLEKFGVSAMSDTELIAMMLRGNGTAPDKATLLATRLMAEAGSIPALLGWSLTDWQQMKGIGPVKATQLVALTEIGRRMLQGPSVTAPILNRADLVADHFTPIATGLSVEKFWVLCLNRKNRLIKRIEVTSGTATAALAHPREVFREAIRHASAAIVCVHNHPSGDPAPSAADVQVTRQLREGARTLDVQLLDHVIVGATNCDPLGVGYYSFRSAGML